MQPVLVTHQVELQLVKEEHNSDLPIALLPQWYIYSTVAAATTLPQPMQAMQLAHAPI